MKGKLILRATLMLAGVLMLGPAVSSASAAGHYDRHDHWSAAEHGWRYGHTHAHWVDSFAYSHFGTADHHPRFGPHHHSYYHRPHSRR